MPLHVGLRQFDTDGETLHDQDDPGALEGKLVDVPPRYRVEKVCGVRSENNTTQRGNGCFSNVELLLDKQGAQHEKACEPAKDHVCQMWLVEIEVVPRHDGEINENASSQSTGLKPARLKWRICSGKI